jgi:hypothetical protein
MARGKVIIHLHTYTLTHLHTYKVTHLHTYTLTSYTHTLSLSHTQADRKRVEHIKAQKAYIAAQLGHLQLNPKEEKGIIKIQAMVSPTFVHLSVCLPVYLCF